MDTDTDDLWDGFYRPKSLRSVNPPIFVPASASYPTRDDDDDQDGNDNSDDVATWYRSLSRQTTNPHNPPAATLEAPPEPSPPTTLRRSHDWFAISRHSTPGSSTLADLLSRNPPTAARPFRPPVFLHLGPSNKGWVMLQNQGWSEGEGLGRSAHRSRDAKRLPNKSGSLLPSTSEVLLDHHHDIVEVPVIDLTLSDSEEGDDDDRPPPPSESSSDPTVLLTPLPTVLKSDRLGIGLKAKTEGPYRSSVKRVTPNAAALAAHAKASEDLRRTQHRFGKGRRAYSRAEHLERERRQNMMAYLNQP